MNITSISKRSGLSIALLVGAAVSLPISANAATFTFTIPVSSVDSTDPNGTPFTVVGNFLATDTIDLTATGSINLSNDGFGGQYTTNAAGITTIAATTGIPGTPAGSVSANASPVFNYGELLLGNNTLGFKQLFPANAANGLGTAGTPSVSISNVTLASLGFASGLNDGEILFFKIGDSAYGDNIGAFSVSGSMTGTAVPEPFTVIGTLIGGTAALRMRKKLRADKPEN